MLAVGLAVLTAGAEFLVRGASGLALAMKVPPLIVGLTVVAFGTSAPELVVSLESSLSGQADVALGNVLGSNILNVLLILGLSALIVPLVVDQQLVRLDVPLMVFISGLVGFQSFDGRIGRFDGLLLVSGLVAWNLWLIRASRRERQSILEEYEREFGAAAEGSAGARHLFVCGLMLVGGFVMLVLGARLFVQNAVEIARALGVSDVVIGLTLVAAGTSLPEVATSVVAALRGERDIAVGNVVGSNLFNLLCVLGITSSVTGGMPVSSEVLAADIPVMVAVAVACMPVFFTGRRIERWEGGVFLGFYILYTTARVLDATDSSWLDPVKWFALGVAIPATLAALAVSHLRWQRERRQTAEESVPEREPVSPSSAAAPVPPRSGDSESDPGGGP